MPNIAGLVPQRDRLIQVASKLVCVVGARPNLVKAMPLLKELDESGIDCRLVHTGQHYDHEMSQTFFDDLQLPEPDAHLGVGSGTHGVQTAAALVGIEGWLLEHPVEGLIAIGDVNSTLAAALAAAKLHIPIAHVEAGYRSRDMRMPEEVNRLVTDQISSLLLAPTSDAVDNLVREGIDPTRIEFSGNLMAQTFLSHQDAARERRPWVGTGVEPGGYVVATIHRPENTEHPYALASIVDELGRGPHDVVWPVHPRIRDAVSSLEVPRRIHLIEPLSYLDMIALVVGAVAVVTDSGGLQEEACLARVPCVTVRGSTERTVTVDVGANRLCPAAELEMALHEALESPRDWNIPEKWDVEVAARMASALSKLGSPA